MENNINDLALYIYMYDAEGTENDLYEKFPEIITEKAVEAIFDRKLYCRLFPKKKELTESFSLSVQAAKKILKEVKYA